MPLRSLLHFIIHALFRHIVSYFFHLEGMQKKSLYQVAKNIAALHHRNGLIRQPPIVLNVDLRLVYNINTLPTRQLLFGGSYIIYHRAGTVRFLGALGITNTHDSPASTKLSICPVIRSRVYHRLSNFHPLFFFFPLSFCLNITINLIIQS